MKIALIGYGKMGKTIERLISEKTNHEVCIIITSYNKNEFDKSLLKQADVAIEFTAPEFAIANMELCNSLQIPIVVGTTGWLQQLESAKSSCLAADNALLYASNFSIGVNLMFHFNAYMQEVLSNYPAYKVSINEEHHTEKKDAPSGTAITLADQIIAKNDRLRNWTNKPSILPEDVVILSSRKEDVKGLHTVVYESENDIIRLEHEAKNRDGFAMGAILAAEWLHDKKGIFTMNDVLKIK
jgi:4-hydroxy-tetrahydrodipicolinate reductase